MSIAKENNVLKADIGLIGLAVMGENLVLNMESKGFTVAVYNRTTSKVSDFLSGRANRKRIIGCFSVEQFVDAISVPRKVMMMVKAGEVVDQFIALVSPFLSVGDTIIDGGNSNWNDTNRRISELASKGIYYVGAGVSGGEDGALNGPSIMPGGTLQAWPALKPIFQAICAKVC